jgi:hypothetical protein
LKAIVLKTLENLAKFCAILAGVLLTFITLMTCLSIVGRETIGKTISGDFELSGVAAGAAIALFMPWCQFKRGNILSIFLPTRLLQARKTRWSALVLYC